MELFADPGFSDRSAMVDYQDWALESYDDFDQLDGETTDPDNFSDDPSSVRWFAPVGCTLRLNDDDFGDDDFPGDNVRTLPGQGVVVEGAFADLANVSNDAGDDDMDSSITSVEFRPDCDAYYSATMGVEWDLDGNGSFETTRPGRRLLRGDAGRAAHRERAHARGAPDRPAGGHRHRHGRRDERRARDHHGGGASTPPVPRSASTSP